MENTAAFFSEETMYINYITDIENSIRKSGRVFENKQKNAMTHRQNAQKERVRV